MKFTQRFVSILFVILACVVGGVLWSIPMGKTLALADSKCDVSGALSSDIPVNPMLMPYCTRMEQLANFSWKTFVALNWPSDCQGYPLKDGNIGESPQKPRVWEFYNFPSDVFKPNGAKPNPQPVIPPQCLTHIPCQCPTKNNRIQSVADVTIFLAEPVPEVFGNNAKSLTGKTTLVDRAGNYTLNEVRMNPVEVKQIVGNDWYSADQFTKLEFNNQFDNSGNPFQLICSNIDPDGTYPSVSTHIKVPCTGDREADAREGTIEIKASWKVLPPSPISSFSDEYYTTERTLDVETSVGKEEKTTVPVALVGFHIVEKTSQQGWIWSTFEHKNNVPDNAEIASADYNFYDRDCTGNCEENTPLATPPYLWRKDFPHAVTKTDGIIKQQTPSQITRLVPIPKSVQSLNEKWQKKLETSVWRNYQLIGVQWLENPYDPYNLAEVGGRSVTPSSLANVTIEPYVQKNELGRSCIACHTFARLPNKQVKADFSFLMSEAKYTALANVMRYARTILRTIFWGDRLLPVHSWGSAL